MDQDRLVAFAAHVSQARKAFKTRKDFCATVGISRATLRSLESGRQQPEQGTIEKLARVMGTTAARLTNPPPMAPDDPRLKDLNAEDLNVAQAFHHATTETRLKVRRLLNGADDPPE